MGGDLNIRDTKWNLSISSYSIAGQVLRDLTDSYSLICLIPVLSVPTHYSDIQDHANTVINLIFLGMSYAQVFYHIEPDLRHLLNHALL